MEIDPRSFAAALAKERGCICVDDGVLAVPLFRGRGRNTLCSQFVLISKEDAHLTRYHWSLTPHGYVRRREAGTGKGITLHREVAGLPPGEFRNSGAGPVVDHINGDKLDCRRENLRIITQGQNAQNRRSINGSSKYRGVSAVSKGRGRHKRSYQAYGRKDGTMVHLGFFDSEDDAAAAARAWREENLPFSYEGPPPRGVDYDRARGKWRAQATLNYKNHFIGHFDTEEEAADAVAAWRREHMSHSSD